MSEQSIESARDANGQEIFKGDTVATLADNTSAKVGDLCEDMGTEFIRLKLLHQPYGKGIWYAADTVIRISGPARKKSEKNGESESSAKVTEKKSG